ncbi:glycosyltransferase [Microbacterium sp. ASV49]|uniref:Glycosyltransferase n=1 Tax=Microbacterium candidum TaxID=3041922 RepID=A0ABT7N0W7_9MICO|nr:glycosyltransferase [Microbacterium sp. ASV49]MDL9980306.1 glycosyltransferase [Microbacterium sp. ASV49]
MTAQPISQKKDVFVSVVTVVDSTSRDVEGLIRATQSLLDQHYTNYELVVVDNGVAIESVRAIHNVLRDVPCVRVLRLARAFPYDTAVFSALESVIGDYTVVLEADVDPIDQIPAFVEALLDGADIVQGLAPQARAHGFVQRIGRRAFYRYNSRSLGVEIPEDATYFTAFTRRALTSVLSSSRQYRYLRHLMRHVGFMIVDLPYTQIRRRERPRHLRAAIVEAVEMVTSYSVHPLRVMSILGVAVAIINLLYAVYVVVVYFSVPDVARGWTTTSLQISIMFLFLSIAVAIISEYVGRLLAESRREPAYFIMEELVSDQTIADETRHNVV